jgi:hypothetical protein
MASQQIEVEVKASDMEEAMIQKVKDISLQALKENKQEKQIANYIKESFDK